MAYCCAALPAPLIKRSVHIRSVKSRLRDCCWYYSAFKACFVFNDRRPSICSEGVLLRAIGCNLGNTEIYSLPVISGARQS